MSRIDLSATITSVAPNPKRPGTGAHRRYALYKVGSSLAQFLENGGTRGDINWDLKQGFVRVGGDPSAAVGDGALVAQQRPSDQCPACGALRPAGSKPVRGTFSCEYCGGGGDRKRTGRARGAVAPAVSGPVREYKPDERVAVASCDYTERSGKDRDVYRVFAVEPDGSRWRWRKVSHSFGEVYFLVRDVRALGWVEAGLWERVG